MMRRRGSEVVPHARRSGEVGGLPLDKTMNLSAGTFSPRSPIKIGWEVLGVGGATLNTLYTQGKSESSPRHKEKGKRLARTFGLELHEATSCGSRFSKCSRGSLRFEMFKDHTKV